MKTHGVVAQLLESFIWAAWQAEMKKNPRKAFAVQAPNLEDASVFDCVADCMVCVCVSIFHRHDTFL